MRFLEPGRVPRRLRKRDPNAIEEAPEFKALKAAIANNRMAPGEQVGLSFDSDDKKKLDMKWPARVAADALKRWLSESQITELYQVRKFNIEGRQFVSVTRRKARQKSEKPAVDHASPAAKMA
jgi:hypothetical protein